MSLTQRVLSEYCSVLYFGPGATASHIGFPQLLPKFVGLAAPNDRVDPRDLVWRRRMDQLRRRCASTEDTNREKRPVRRFVERRTSS